RFVFSSRRRHTRFSRDWSSDMCSSDLFAELAIEDAEPTVDGELCEFCPLGSSSGGAGEFPETDGVHLAAADDLEEAHPVGTVRRSEERRVGKESGSRQRRHPVKTWTRV